jgi:hypothetical protein
MRTQASWEELQRALNAARVLADFANLESEEDAQRFRKDHGDFVPRTWWDYQPTTPDGAPSPKKQWQIAQKFLRDAWLFEFDISLFDYVHLLTSVFDPDDLESTLFEKRYHPPFATGLELGDESPYHLAVKWLAGQGWRAKTCFCGKRFVAEHSQTKFCGGNKNACFWAHRKSKQHSWWIKHSKGINNQRRRNYQLEKKRSHRANRKNLPQR